MDKSSNSLAFPEILWILLSTVLGFFIAVGLILGFLNDYKNIGLKEGIDFLWELIQFCFILAGFIFAIDSRFFNSLDARKASLEKKIVSLLALNFTLSGVLFILSVGASAFFNQTHLNAFYYICVFLVNLAIVLLSFGLSLMFLGAVRRSILIVRS